MEKVRNGLILLALATGCGGGASSGSAGGTCTVTFSGAKAGTSDCVASILDESAAGGPTVPFFDIADVDSTFSFTVQPVTEAPATYMTGNALLYVRGQASSPPSGGNSDKWLLSENGPPSSPNAGTYHLDVTGAASAPANVKVAAGTAKQWKVQGTLDATLTADPATATMGDVTVHVDFHDKAMF